MSRARVELTLTLATTEFFCRFYHSQEKDFRKATKWRQVSLRTEIVPMLDQVDYRSVPGETSLRRACIPGPPVFQRVTLTNWVGPGDEAIDL